MDDLGVPPFEIILGNPHVVNPQQLTHALFTKPNVRQGAKIKMRAPRLAKATSSSSDGGSPGFQ